jgi:hypothetical protein
VTLSRARRIFFSALTCRSLAARVVAIFPVKNGATSAKFQTTTPEARGM